MAALRDGKVMKKQSVGAVIQLDSLTKTFCGFNAVNITGVIGFVGTTAWWRFAEQQ
jgi:hypothetical protein